MKKTLKLMSFAAAAITAVACCNNQKPAEKVVIEPGEQAPLADPGQKNFGGSAIVGDTTGMAERRRRFFRVFRHQRLIPRYYSRLYRAPRRKTIYGRKPPREYIP